LNEKEKKRLRTDLGLRGRCFVVGFLGDFGKEKGSEDFKKVADLIVGLDEKVKFVVVGEREERRITKDNFVFTGFLCDARLAFSVFDLIFYPIIIGSISLSLLEAMGMGVPVVTRDVGGNRELVIHNKTGILFKNERPEELAKIILNLLRDKKRREAMGRAARARVKKYFSEERWVKEMRAVWEVEEK
jgi:glycosyltransferase involved in cell wall biosynthesis